MKLGIIGVAVEPNRDLSCSNHIHSTLKLLLYRSAYGCILLGAVHYKLTRANCAVIHQEGRDYYKTYVQYSEPKSLMVHAHDPSTERQTCDSFRPTS